MRAPKTGHKVLELEKLQSTSGESRLFQRKKLP